MEWREEGRLKFRFDEPRCSVFEYDKSNYYSKRFQGIADCKGVDFVILDSQHTIWLIEVKDYRNNVRTKPLDLVDELAAKIVDSMAGLFSAKYKATDSEQLFAEEAVNTNKLRVVFHLEGAKHPTKRAEHFKLSSLQIKLRQTLKNVDPRALVVDHLHMTNVIWECRTS